MKFGLLANSVVEHNFQKHLRCYPQKKCFPGSQGTQWVNVMTFGELMQNVKAKIFGKQH